MRAWGLLCLGLMLKLACGGVVDDSPPGTEVGPDWGSGGTGTGGAGSWRRDGGAGGPQDGGTEVPRDVRSDYVEPDCPDAAPLPVRIECDLSAAYSGCPSGQACYPYVFYPDSDDDCAQEQYGTTCAPEGDGVQGDPCTGASCAGGHSCVLTGQGTQCVELCDVFGENTCPPGYLCLPIDVQPGVGGCY